MNDDMTEGTMLCPECGVLVPVEAPGGVWVAFSPDRKAIYSFLTEIGALRFAVGKGLEVSFAEFGTEIFGRS